VLYIVSTWSVVFMGIYLFCFFLICLKLQRGAFFWQGWSGFETIRIGMEGVTFDSIGGNTREDGKFFFFFSYYNKCEMAFVGWACFWEFFFFYL